MKFERPATPQEPGVGSRRNGHSDRQSVVTVTGAKQPQLRLMGRWLERAGFDTGTWAEVHAGAGRIVIEARAHLSEPGAIEARARARRRIRA